MTNEELAAMAERRDFSREVAYLVKLADWCAGQGFCQIEGIEDPEEWCYRMWSDLGPENGDGYSAEALAEVLLSQEAGEGSGGNG